jgi:CRP-like cAMP-binding protein
MQTNSILSRLASEDCQSLLRRAERVRFEREAVLAEIGSPIERVLFPLSGMVSIVVELTDGARTECAMLGARGALGALAAFGAERHTATAICQIPGECWSVPAVDVAELAGQNGDFRGLLLWQEQFLQAQAQQTAACNARHNVSERLASWLLRSREAIGSDKVTLTQEVMAQMLGVQRASVSMSAGRLAAAGAIEYTRGRIQILDAQKLADSACECHDALKQCHRSLFKDAATEGSDSKFQGPVRERDFTPPLSRSDPSAACCSTAPDARR